MASWNKWLWGGLGWAFGGPIGGVIGFAIGAVTDEALSKSRADGTTQSTRPGDFGVALLILCAAVMKSDNRVMKSELEFVKQFFIKQFGVEHAQERMLLFKEILKQEYSLRDVCFQIAQNLDYQSRLQMMHLLFGVSNADGEIHPLEIQTLEQIAEYMGVQMGDFSSIMAMFVKDTTSAYRVLEVESTTSIEDIKKAYRRLAVLHHPDKVHHLGADFQKDAQEKFKQINEAYDQIKKERGFK